MAGKAVGKLSLWENCGIFRRGKMSVSKVPGELRLCRGITAQGKNLATGGDDPPFRRRVSVFSP